MELTVPHRVRRPPSSSPSDADALFRAALLPPAVAADAVPVQTTPFILDSEADRPHRTSDSDQKLNPDTNARGEARTAPSILLVEDDPDITMGLQDLLEFKGFHVDCVRTCRQALSSIEQKAYHAILLDLGLPDGDGCTILEKLQVSHPSLPVIVLTASNRNLGSLRAYARLTKPWDQAELCGILHRAIGTVSSSAVS